MSIKAEIKGNGKNKVLHLEIPMNDHPVPSASGKTLVVASSYGNQTTSCEVNGKPLTVGVNAYIRP